MENRILIAQGVGYLLIALGIGAFQSVTDPNAARDILLVGPFVLLAGVWVLPWSNNDPWRTARGALGMFVTWVGVWAALWGGLVMLFPPQFGFPTSWQDMLPLAAIHGLLMSGGALGLAWRLHKHATLR